MSNLENLALEPGILAKTLHRELTS